MLSIFIAKRQSSSLLSAYRFARKSITQFNVEQLFNFETVSFYSLCYFYKIFTNFLGFFKPRDYIEIDYH